MTSRYQVSKESVNYRRAFRGSMAMRNEHCGNCSMFVKPSSCILVRGQIKSVDVCDRWEKKE